MIGKLADATRVIAGPFAPGEIARGDVITVRYHGRLIRSRVYEACETALHFTWVGDDAERSPWRTVDPQRDGGTSYKDVLEIVLPPKPRSLKRLRK